MRAARQGRLIALKEPFSGLRSSAILLMRANHAGSVQLCLVGAQSTAWKVVTNDKSTTPFDFCVEDLRALR